jgi:uncharacterized repeat protein (TIGR03803 family)
MRNKKCSIGWRATLAIFQHTERSAMHALRIPDLGKRNWVRTAYALLLLLATTAIALHAATFTDLASFDGTDGLGPGLMSLVQGTDGNFYGTTQNLGASGIGPYGTVFKITPGGTLTALYSFCSQSGCTDGETPAGALLQAANGKFYGTTSAGGANGLGTIFEITTGGTLTTLQSFDSTDGANPNAGLVQVANGDFYGTAAYGGANGVGTVFKMTAGGTLTVLHSFAGADGANPLAPLIQAANGDFYGTTQDGGSGSNANCEEGCGTVFKITPGGTLTTLHSFSSTDGSNLAAGLAQAANGNFYGTTQDGGSSSNCEGGCGTVFKITPGGTLTTLHSFDGPDGEFPAAGLVQATDGNFYGTTTGVGANGDGGTVFKITPGGTLTTLHSFDGPDGEFPAAGLVQATDGNFYGTTTGVGANGDGGTVFKITPGGTLTTLYNFCTQSHCTDGASPDGGLFQATNGNLYGTTFAGGVSDDGVVFRLSVGLGPFVETQTTSGKVGAAVKILGTKLTGATSVTFNGTAAVFTVVSSSEITTTVPAGATTGKVQVTTPSGTLSSNVAFRVTPQITSFAPPSGPVGTSVTITGVSLTQTTQVTFGGVKAITFSVTSDTQVTATVPTGAVTGRIVITTAGGTATSATSFTVTP